MLMRNAVCLCAAMLAILCAPALRAGPSGYAQRVWHAEDGLPEETVQAFAQTPDHFLWIGTTGGLVRFDGAQFVVFDRENTPALRENSIFCLLAARDGTLWIGTEGGGMVSYRHGAFRRWSAADGLGNGYVRALREDHRGRVWIGTDDGLFRWQTGKIERYDGRNGVPLSAIHAIYEDRQRRLWAGGFHFLCIDDSGAREFRLPGGLTDNVKSILQTRDGAIWVGTVSGLQRAAANGSAPPNFTRVRGVRSTVRTLLEDEDGALWIGTIGEGLIRWREGRFSKLSAGTMLPSKTILGSFSGIEHDIWIGAQAGLVRLNKTAVSTVVLPDFADADFGTISSDANGALWVSSSHLFRLTGRRAQMLHFSGPLANVRIRNVFRDSTGTLWFGTEGKGAFRWVNGAPRAVPLIQPYIRAFAEDRQGSVWIGTDGGYCRWRPSQVRCFAPHESVRALHVDRRGDVWVGMDRGLARMRNGGDAADAPIPRLRDEKVWAIHEDASGALWFGTRSSGLFRWKAGQLTSYSTAQGLASNSIYQILEDRHGAFWLSGPNGISSIARRDLERIAYDPLARPAVKLYGTSEGLKTTQMYGGVQPAGCATASGEIWFPSTAGAVRIGPDPADPVSAPPAVIHDFIADGRQVSANGPIELRPGEGKLEIQYSAIQFRSQDRVRFRYRLEGFENGWTETSARRASYTNIPSGHYRFHLLAFDIAKPDATSEASVSFYWRPHFYRAWWFYLLCAASAAGVVWYGYRARMRQAQARFEAVLGERNRLAREMHDTLIQGCTGVSALLEAMATASPREGATGNLLDCARTQIRAVTDEAREAVWNLHRGGRQEIGRLMDEMARQVGAASAVPVRFESSGKPVVLDPMMEHDVMMVAREAVYNAIRHAQPREVSLKMQFRRGRLQLRVTDDGCGFDPEEVLPRIGGQFGLIGMRERTERLGGRFAVHSGPGRGTELCVDVPVHSRGSEA